MKETISIKVTFTLEIKLQKYIFQDIMTIFSRYCALLEPLLRRQCICVRHDQITEKEVIYGKKSENKTNNWHTSHIHLGK